MLTLRHETQGDTGTVVPETPAGAPAGAVVGRMARLTTLIAALVTALICGTVIWSGLTIADLDWMHTAVPLVR